VFVLGRVETAREESADVIGRFDQENRNPLPWQAAVIAAAMPQGTPP
jgi:hypothetical protein